MPQRVVQPGEPFSRDSANGPAVRGFLHRPQSGLGDGWVLTHGAGGNCGSTLLVRLTVTFAAAGVFVLRCDLPFRQARRQGPPRPADSAKDREGLRAALAAMREIVPGKVFLGGQSYGGRQATMLTAEDRDVADGLVLLSYPLHAPKTPDKKRIEHLPRLHVPALFVHGTRDPFGTPEEMEAARTMIPAETRLVLADGAGHALIPAKASGVRVDEVATWIRSEFLSFFSGK